MKITEKLIINEQIKQLQHSLQLKFGLSPGTPNRAEIVKIIERMRDIPRYKRTNRAWSEVVNEVVEEKGLYKYEGVDFSSANNLLDQIEQLLKG